MKQEWMMRRGTVEQRVRHATFGWKLLSLFGALAAVGFALLSLCLKRKNDRYRDALIDLSEQLPMDDGCAEADVE